MLYHFEMWVNCFERLYLPYFSTVLLCVSPSVFVLLYIVLCKWFVSFVHSMSIFFVFECLALCVPLIAELSQREMLLLRCCSFIAQELTEFCVMFYSRINFVSDVSPKKEKQTQTQMREELIT